MFTTILSPPSASISRAVPILASIPWAETLCRSTLSSAACAAASGITSAAARRTGKWRMGWLLVLDASAPHANPRGGALFPLAPGWSRRSAPSPPEDRAAGQGEGVGQARAASAPPGQPESRESGGQIGTFFPP